MERPSNCVKMICCVLALSCVRPFRSWGWGGDGHQLVCLIAEEHLTKAARVGIHDLLGQDVNISDAEIASWADEIRRQRRETGPWHYVDIPFDAEKYDPKRDGREGDNVVGKIDDFIAVLKDPEAAKAKRVEALKFLVHFVGDLHQPLHCAERNGDKGGNGRLVFFLDRPKALNLHSAWDTTILLSRKKEVRNLDYAKQLNSAISANQITEWQKGTIADWANDSHSIAVKTVYAGVPADGPPPKLDQKYVDAAGDVIDLQLKMGGVRLAGLLNDIFQ